MNAFCWWLFYSIAASYAQFFFVTYDFFLPGLIVSLQNRNWQQTSILFIVWTIIGEGCHRLVFGSVFLSYLGVITFFFIGSRLLESQSTLFVFFLTILSAIWQWTVLCLQARLQGIHFSYSFYIIATQFLITMVGWLLCSTLYRRMTHGKN